MSVHETVDHFETKHMHLNFCPVQDVILELAFPTIENLYKPQVSSHPRFRSILTI